MHRNSASLICLSLFTTVDRAAEIEGDLKEESIERGRFWYVLQLLSTIFALFWHAMVRDLFVVILLSLSVLQLIFTVDRLVVAPLRFLGWSQLGYNQTILAYGIHYLSWGLPAFLWGAVLMLCLGKYGARTLVITAVVIMIKVPLVWAEFAPLVSFLEAFPLVFLPLLTGGLLIHAKRVSQLLAKPETGQLN